MMKKKRKKKKMTRLAKVTIFDVVLMTFVVLYMLFMPISIPAKMFMLPSLVLLILRLSKDIKMWRYIRIFKKQVQNYDIKTLEDMKKQVENYLEEHK